MQTHNNSNPQENGEKTSNKQEGFIMRYVPPNDDGDAMIDHRHDDHVHPGDDVVTDHASSSGSGDVGTLVDDDSGSVVVKQSEEEEEEERQKPLQRGDEIELEKSGGSGDDDYHQNVVGNIDEEMEFEAVDAMAREEEEEEEESMEEESAEAEEERTKHLIEEMNLSATAMNRVKLYHLNGEGRWDDMGTGHVCCEFVQPKRTMCLIMISETTPEDSVQKKLLESRISRDDIYQLQGDSLIVWSDIDTGIDTALSFQESEGCCQVWDQIRLAQGRRADSQEIVTKNKSQKVEIDNDGIIEEDDEHGEDFHTTELPEPNFSNLKDRWIEMSDVLGGYRASIALCRDPTYFDKLFNLFDMAENLQDMESLHILYRIFENIILFDKNEIFEILFSENKIMKLMGVLEYDPDLQHTSRKKANHREILNNSVVYKKVAEFSDPTVEIKIHQSFKINYLKDTILPKVLDDSTFNTLNTMVQLNNVDIIKAIRSDTQFMEELFQDLKRECELIRNEKGIPESHSPFAEGPASNGRTPPPSRQHQRRIDLIRFLQEYTGMLKVMSIPLKESVYSTLLENGLLYCMEWLLMDNAAVVRHATSDILCSLISLEPGIVREFIMLQYKSVKTKCRSGLLESIIQRVTSEPEVGIQDSISEAFKMLFDPEQLQPETKDEFLDVLYKTTPVSISVRDSSSTNADNTNHVDNATKRRPYINWLARPFEKFVYRNDHLKIAEQRELLRSEEACQAYTRILDILGHFVIYHGYRIKNFVIGSNFLLHVSNLLDTSSLFRKDVSLSAIRFIRKCLSLQDTFYNANMVDHDIFCPVIHIWKDNEDRYNLINSSIIELFETIRINNVKKLISYSVKNYRDIFEQVEYVDTFRMMIIRYDKMQSNGQGSDHDDKGESSTNRGSESQNVDTFIEQRALENWFEHDDDDGDISMESSDASDSTTITGEIPAMSFPRVSGSGDGDDDDNDDSLFGPSASISSTAIPINNSTSGGRPGTPIKTRPVLSISLDNEGSTATREGSDGKRPLEQDSQHVGSEMKRRKIDFDSDSKMRRTEQYEKDGAGTATPPKL